VGLHSGSSFEFGSNEILFLLFISFSGFPVCVTFFSRPFCLVDNWSFIIVLFLDTIARLNISAMKAVHVLVKERENERLAEDFAQNRYHV